MYKRFFNRKGQSTVEYAVLITVVLGAFLSIQIYFKRGIQGRWKENVDQLGDQYDPRITEGTVRHTLISETITTIEVEDFDDGFVTTRTDDVSTEERKEGAMSTGPF